MSRPTDVLPYAARGAQQGGAWRLAWSRIGWETIVPAALGALSLLWAHRLPLSEIAFDLLAFALFLVTLVLWAPRALAQVAMLLLSRNNNTEPGSAEREASRLWVGWIVPPMIVVVACWLVSYDVPLRVGIAISRPAMDRFAKQLASAPPGAKIPRTARLGIYSAVEIQPIPGGVRFLVEGSGFFRSAGGFAYSPDAPPPPQDGDLSDVYTSIDGGWYVRRWIKP
jgi:hypothetical protein